MGIDLNGAKFLFFALRHGVDFTETATIGRQSMLLSHDQFVKQAQEFGHEIDAAAADRLLETGYVEPFLEMLGARSITSIDASGYEGSTLIHDLNMPIADQYKAGFSVVFDGGSLEHVFNFPVAIKSCLEMVRPGGHYLAITPTNNYCGHGFYQFSPELYHRVLSPVNGFILEKLMIVEELYENPWYDVADPADIHERVTLVNSVPTNLLVIARRLKDVPIFSSLVQQSDYAEAWVKGGAPYHKAAKNGLLQRIWNRLDHMINRSSGMIQSSEKHFKKIDPQ